MFEKISESLPKLSQSRTDKLGDHIGKAEVSILAQSVLLLGLVAIRVAFGADEDVIERKI